MKPIEKPVMRKQIYKRELLQQITQYYIDIDLGEIKQ